MDTLHKRYACPFSVLNEFIELGQLHEYVNELMKILHEEHEEAVSWEYYLHKVFDKSYDTFMEDMKKELEAKKNSTMNSGQIKNIVSDSASLLDKFSM